MALQVSLTADQSGIGAPVPTAYVRIVAVQYSVQDENVTFAVEYYWDQNARDAGSKPISGQTFVCPNFDFSIDMSAKKALYLFMKTFPQFSNAVDI